MSREVHNVSAPTSSSEKQSGGLTQNEWAVAAVCAGLSAVSLLGLLPKSGLDVAQREYISSMLGAPDFNSLPIVEPEALKMPSYDSHFKSCVESERNGTTSLVRNFQFIGDVSFLKAISLKSGSDVPDFNLYTFDALKSGHWETVIAIKPANDPIKLVGEHSKVHLAGHFADGGRTRGGIWYGDTEKKASGIADGPIIVVDYLKVLQKE